MNNYRTTVTPRLHEWKPALEMTIDQAGATYSSTHSKL